MENRECFIGIDVSKSHLDVAVRPVGEHWRCSNDDKTTGRLAKTDALDADILARFGEVVRPEVRPLSDADAQELSALLQRRRQLIEMLAAEKNRLKSIRKSLKINIEWLERQLAEVDGDLTDTIRKSPVWREKDDLLKSVPGVGRVLAVTLINKEAYYHEKVYLNRNSP